MGRNRIRGWISKRYNIILFSLESEKRREIRFSALSLVSLVFLFVFLVFFIVAIALLVLDYVYKREELLIHLIRLTFALIFAQTLLSRSEVELIALGYVYLLVLVDTIIDLAKYATRW